MSFSSFSTQYNNPMADLGEGFANAQVGASGMMSKFRNNKMVSGGTDFLYSNSLVAKVCFLVLIIIIFIISVRLGSKVVTWALSPPKNPTLVTGMQKGTESLHIPGDPNAKDSITILRSVNEREGLEFTWSVWLYIESISNPATGDQSCSAGGDTKYRHIFNKGDGPQRPKKADFMGINTNGIHFPNNSPGLYISQETNELVVVMNTFDTVIEQVKIPDIPIKKWINVVLRVQGKNMDTYINGTIVSRHIFKSVPKQNYGDVFVSSGGGFDGELSSLRYFNHAITGVEVENIVKAGPNLTPNNSLRTFPPYLALRWFFNKPTLAQ